MGTDIHIRILKKDSSTDKWKQIKLYRKNIDHIEIVKIYPYRNYELFDILNGNEEHSPDSYPIVLNHLPKNIYKEIKSNKDSIGTFGFKEINLADLKLYLFKTPKVRDYDYDDNDSKAWKDNPVKYFIERIEQYINFADPDFLDFRPSSEIKILYWFDC